MKFRTGFWLAAAAWFFCLAADDKTPVQPDAREALTRLQTYVGQWRGVGQVRRGSARGAWIEESEWIWKFKPDSVALAFASEKGKYFQRGALYATDEPGSFRLVAEHDGMPVEYSGSLGDDGQLKLVTTTELEDLPARISIRTVADGDRLVVLYEARTGNDRYQRLAEVGFTRQGSNFGKGTSFVECVVTGGQGTIPVTFEGKTYYVCCTGCRDYFNDDPETVLAEYREKKAKDKDKSAPRR